MVNLSSDGFAEECIMKSDNVEIKNKLNEYDNKIDKNSSLLVSQIATMIGGAAGLIAGAVMDRIK